MEIITLAIGGAIGFGIGAIERFRLNNKIKKLLTGLPDTQEVSHSLSLVSLVRREINHLNDLCAEYLDTIAHWRGVMSLSPLGYLLIDQENNLEWCNLRLKVCYISVIGNRGNAGFFWSLFAPTNWIN
uniref:ORF 127 protein n=1 Tax=Synechocystis TaxID=1142 RepID=Q57330_9SYNC|nr:ORF 127 [Synechocystis]BAA00894.1 unnamed protein product [Synechocystis sp. PCC 6803]